MLSGNNSKLRINFNTRLPREPCRLNVEKMLIHGVSPAAEMRAINDPQAILETAAAELRNALRVKSVQVRLQTVDTEAAGSTRLESGPAGANPARGGER